MNDFCYKDASDRCYQNNEVLFGTTPELELICKKEGNLCIRSCRSYTRTRKISQIGMKFLTFTSNYSLQSAVRTPFPVNTTSIAKWREGKQSEYVLDVI